MDNAKELEALQRLDQHFVEIYETARAELVERQERAALIVINGDALLLYRGDQPVQTFSGLEPPLYNKMKTLGHVPLAVFCLLDHHTDETLTADLLARTSAYRVTLALSAELLDTGAEARQGLLPRPSDIFAKAIAFLDAILARGRVSREELTRFTREAGEDVGPLIAAAVRAQLDACHAIVTHIRQHILTDEQWRELRVLILGAYIARQNELFLQYFARILHTPMQGDKRLVYFEGNDLQGAYDRLGTTMLDVSVANAFFRDSERMHRDLLGNEATRYLLDPAGMSGSRPRGPG